MVEEVLGQAGIWVRRAQGKGPEVARSTRNRQTLPGKAPRKAPPQENPRAQSPEPRAQSPEPRTQNPKTQNPEPRTQNPEPRTLKPWGFKPLGLQISNLTSRTKPRGLAEQIPNGLVCFPAPTQTHLKHHSTYLTGHTAKIIVQPVHL